MTKALFLLLLASAVILPPSSFAQDDPRNPNMVWLPELGRISGTIPPRSGVTEQFGRAVSPVSDVDHDGLSDWIVERFRPDSIFDGFAPHELLLYRGVRGGLPTVESGVRIGPSELHSQCAFLAAGDWDGDQRIDVAISQTIIGDTSEGIHGAPIRRLVIYWGSPGGEFSNDDTTHLNLGSTTVYALNRAASGRFAMGSADDLLVYGGGAWIAGQFRRTPVMQIFRGHQGKRWGRNGTSRHSDWHWWTPPEIGDLRALDQDGDGHLDIVMSVDRNGGYGEVSVLYGRAGELPDTNDVQSVSFAPSNGHTSIFSDLTGDKVPELSMACGSEEVIRVYVGMKGQRLLEQYGSGMEPPNPSNQQRWWGKPWAELWLPRKFDSRFNSAGFQPLLDMGDVGLDGVGDLGAIVDDGIGPGFIAFYNGGRYFDHYIDAAIDAPRLRGIRRLGNIDGSGMDVLAATMYHDPGTLIFYKPSADVSRDGEFRRLPPGTDTPAAAIDCTSEAEQTLSLRLWPNPAADEVQLYWEGTHGSALVSLHDVQGRELRRYMVAAEAGQLVIPLTGWPAGIYLVTIRTAMGATSEKLVLE